MSVHPPDLQIIQDPDTGGKLWLHPDGRVYYKEPARIIGTQVDVDRLNRLLAQQRPRRAADRVATILVVLLLITATCCACFASDTALPAGGRWVEAIITAYSPHDKLDEAYRATKGADRWKTAYGVDMRVSPYGIAAPAAYRGARIYLPHASGYLPKSRPLDRVFTVDDTGGLVRSNTTSTGILHLDVRYRTEWSALRFGVTRCWVYVVKP